MGQDTNFCIECGTANPLNAETCSQCQAELIPPHPIQLDGGDIYTLKCEKCQARVLIQDIDGYVRCSNCDTYHKIEKGDGYITISAVLKMKPKDAEVVLAAEDCKPMLLSTLDERLNEMQKSYQNCDALMRRLSEVELSIQKIYLDSKKARNRRNTGMVLATIGLISFFAMGALMRSTSSGNGGMFAFLVFLSFIVGLIGYFLAILSYTKKKRMKLESFHTAMTIEAARIHKDLNDLGPQAGGR